MSGDYSRVRFDPKKDFSGILQQQGRVHLESSANELVRIVDRRFRAQTADTIGRCVVPRQTEEGFRISVTDRVLTIGRGRIYVDGLLVENHGKGEPQFDSCLAEESGEAIGYGEQPYFPNAAQLAPLPDSPGPHLAYVVAYERELTWLEHPDLVEKAIGQDTVTALQTVWQVRLLPDIGAGATCATPDDQIPAWRALTRPSGARLSTSLVEVPEETNPCIIAPGGSGYRGLENQLYRVEIHQGGPVGTATFKWSRENASVATSVVGVNGTTLSVASLGRDSVLRFNNDDWIEITDDWRELAGLPPEMRKASDVDFDAQTLTIDSALPAGAFPVDGQGKLDPARHTRIRRWDQRGADLDASGGVIAVPAAGTAVTLENGVQVSFDLQAGGEFKAYDYWTFAASIADASVEKLQKAPPRGIHRHYGRLAVVTFPSAATDCRVHWPPAPRAEQPAEDRAIHVRRVLFGDERLRNDMELPSPFLSRGLRINLDGPVDPVLVRGKPVCFVTLDMPYPLNSVDRTYWANFNTVGLLGYTPLTLAATTLVEEDRRVISWSPTDPVQRFLDMALFAGFDQLGFEPRVLARLTLKGNFIWSREEEERGPLYLDGDTFGETRDSSLTDVRLPSGDGRRGGDFQMWFWLVRG
jgi:hypothetical protein